MLDRITPLILTFNEEPNLGRLLEALSWAKRIVVLDSGSTDRTGDIARSYPNVALFVRPFDTHASQWNFGLEATGIDTEWVLALDADYGPPEGFVEELRSLSPPPDVDGYRADFVYCIDGQPLSGALYPPVTVLFRRAKASFVQDGHTHRLRLPGRVLPLATQLRHDDRKPLARWFASQVGYMRLEADHLLDTPRTELGAADRLRCLVVAAPVVVFFYCLLAKGGWRDGRAGLFYALQRAVAEVILSAFLVEGALRRGAGGR